MTPTRRHPVSKSVIIFRTKPSGFIFYFNIQMSTRFTVSAVDGRAYATPLVDTISIRAIERRFCVKLVDSGVRKHQHMLKKDRNYPVFAVVLFEFDLTRTRVQCNHTTISWRMECTERLVSLRSNAEEDSRSNEGETLLCTNQTLIHRRIGRELVRGHIRCWKINLHV